MHNIKCLGIFCPCLTITSLSSVYLQLMIEFQTPKNPISALCMYPQYTQLLPVHTAACTAKLISSLQMGAYGNSLDYFPPSPKHRCVLWDQRLSVAAAHAHSLAAGEREGGREGEREFFCSINPLFHPLFSLRVQHTHPVPPSPSSHAPSPCPTHQPVLGVLHHPDVMSNQSQQGSVKPSRIMDVRSSDWVMREGERKRAKEIFSRIPTGSNLPIFPVIFEEQKQKYPLSRCPPDLRIGGI